MTKKKVLYRLLSSVQNFEEYLMSETKQRKTDRRTLYTQQIIKDALLELLSSTSFEKVNVTAVCRQAEIARATFYIHYDSLDDVLDGIIDDALLFSESSAGSMVDLLDTIHPGSTSDIRENETILPACQRIADSAKYHDLFMDPSISDHIIQRIAAHERDKVVPELMKRLSLREDEAEMLFRFMLNGTFAVNRSLGWEKNERWYRYQQILSQFLNGSLR